MFGKRKKHTLPFKPGIFDIRWYPSGRNYICEDRQQALCKPDQMPPLMVRKAEWRR